MPATRVLIWLDSLRAQCWDALYPHTHQHAHMVQVVKPVMLTAAIAAAAVMGTALALWPQLASRQVELQVSKVLRGAADSLEKWVVAVAWLRCQPWSHACRWSEQVCLCAGATKAPGPQCGMLMAAQCHGRRSHD